MQSAKKLATYDDLLHLPRDVKAEVLGGMIVEPPSPLPRHAKVQGAMRRFVGGPFDDDDGRGGPGGWWIFLEVDVRFSPHDIVRPDLVGWKRERLHDPWDTRPIDVVPDWVCEILSPSNQAHDRIAKRRLYAEHGVSFFWLVDPAIGTLEAFRLNDEKQWVDASAYDSTATARIAPFEAVELELARIFPPPVG